VGETRDWNDLKGMERRIVEVLSRSQQGTTRPFLCRGEDSCLYYIKGRGAGRKSLISEWIGGHLCRALGLPIPTFCKAVIPAVLVHASARDDIDELGEGIGFASRVVEFATEFTFPQIQFVNARLRATILLLDWWIANGDRSLTEAGGNPNLLWVPARAELQVIDHNLAFEEEALPEFWSHHIFEIDRSAWSGEFRKTMGRLMTQALADVPEWWGQMPEDWTEIESGITLEKVLQFLWRFQEGSSSFWEV
jgi:hypothetical protein